MYSQSEEEQYIINYFNKIGTKKGTLLDIGAYSPEIFSNSRQLIKDGWSAILIEPSPSCYSNIESFYLGNDKVECLNVAVGKHSGTIDFYDSAGAVATASKEHYDKWKNYQKDYKQIEVPCITFAELYKMFPLSFDFISIDTEGFDFDIIQQIDLNITKTNLVCIEFTYKGEGIYDYIKSFGFELIYSNGENIIMCR
jgi:FkbM family methyltransferase